MTPVARVRCRRVGTGAMLWLAVLSAACASPVARVDTIVPVEDAVRLPGLAEVCPDDSAGTLCAELRTASSQTGQAAAKTYEGLRQSARSLLASGASALDDASLRHYLRERWLALFVWLALASEGAPPADFEAYRLAARERIARHFPHYPAGRFHAAETRLPPEPRNRCEDAQASVLFFPGVVRIEGGGEFAETRRALEQDSCLDVQLVDTGTFVPPAQNATAGCERLAATGGRAVHVVGYSQGARNALEALVTCPQHASGLQSMLALNGAANGSPLADLASLSWPLPELGEQRCTGWGWLRGFFCRLGWWGFGASDRALVSLLDVLLEMSGTPARPEDREQVLRGIRSLGGYAARDFWSTRAGELPTGAYVASFRSIITDREANLPDSNALFHRTIEIAGGTLPYNDMQVRLLDQRIGGPVAGREILSPVAEGNHWQWALEAGQIPEALMPSEMFEGIPRPALVRSHLELVGEIGLLTRPVSPDDADL